MNLESSLTLKRNFTKASLVITPKEWLSPPGTFPILIVNKSYCIRTQPIKSRKVFATAISCSFERKFEFRSSLVYLVFAILPFYFSVGPYLHTSSKRELLRGTARKMERLNKQLRTLEKPRWGFHGERASERSANGVLKDRKSGQTKPLTLIAVRWTNVVGQFFPLTDVKCRLSMECTMIVLLIDLQKSLL